MRFAYSELVTELSATPHGPVSRDAEIDGLSIDSRLLRPGQLFAAVRGERDGHEFVGAAMQAGAAAVLVEHNVDVAPALLVDDVPVALAAFARHARARLPERVVGITGSVGKTTTKDLLASVLATTYRTAASERSFNNELGVPLTLCNAPDDTEATVIEMGARGAGHIAMLCEMARPTVGVVTAVEAVHTELMGGLEQIALAKGELVEAVPADGMAVLNADNALVAAMADRCAGRVLTFGDSGEVRAEGVAVDDELRARFELVSPWGRAPVELGVRGVHNVSNALAAAAVGLGLGIDPEQVAQGLAVAHSSPWRMELRTTTSGARVLNDAYNAGPASVAAALRSLAMLDARRRVAVLGLMAELGEQAPSEHLRIAELCDELGIELVAVGTDLYGVAGLQGVDAAIEALGELGDGDAVLVKGSRVAGLERVAAAL